MAAQYQLDVQNGIVFTTIAGTLTFDDIVEYASKLRNDPAFDSSFSELADFTELKSANLTYADLTEITLRVDPFSKTSKRALIAITGTASYGITRMYQAVGSNSGREMQLFPSAVEARRWLGMAA